MIEHNLDVIAEADWIIDLGPEGGDAGGRIVLQGPPGEVPENRAYRHALAEFLEGHCGGAVRPRPVQSVPAFRAVRRRALARGDHRSLQWPPTTREAAHGHQTDR